MNKNRLRIPIIVLLVAVAVASFGCGGGSRANSPPDGGFTSAVTPDVDSGPSGEGDSPGGSTRSGTGENNSPGSPALGEGSFASTPNGPDAQQLFDNGDTEEELPLPSVYGLDAGVITVQPGESEERGNLVFTCPEGGGPCVVNIGPDGMATYDKTGGIPDFTLLPPEDLPKLPLQGRPQAAQAPIVDLGGVLHVGVDIAPPADQLVARGTYNDVAIRAGRVQDGLGADVVIEFLKEQNRIGHEAFPARPVVHLAEGTRDVFTDYAVRAIQLINAALPYEKRMVFNSDPSTPLASIDDVPDGAIHIDFVPGEHWNPSPEGAVGIALNSLRFVSRNPDTMEETYEKVKSRVMINAESMLSAWVFDFDKRKWEIKVLEERVDDTDTLIKLFSDDTVIKIVAHELLHALAFPEHRDPARIPGSVMGSRFVPGHILLPLDRETLLMAYTRFEPAAAPADISLENLGPWEDTSFHLRGDVDFPGGEASFSVASSNGLIQPWAAGPTPWTNLVDNNDLSGSATWNGALLGITPTLETVAGDARLTVQLTNLDGLLDFTGLEKWEVNEAPGAAGSGTAWGDGDLGYTIRVRGNTFIQTGGDDGQVTGAFFGAAHEAMGGVLERADLSAGFGGKR